jgi:hypothetical protein
VANEVFYSGLSDLRYSLILHRQVQIALTDQASLWQNPAIVNYGDMAGRGSTQLDVPLIGLGGKDRMAAVAENASTSNTALTDSSPAITIARQALQRQISDLAQLTDPSAGLGANIASLAGDMVNSASMRFTEMVAGLVDDFSSTVGTTTVDMSADDWFSAQFTLTQASVPGPYLAVLYPTQLTDLQNSLRGEAGALQFQAATADMLQIKGQGFAGMLNGIDIFASSLVPTATTGADSGGGMFGYGALGYAFGSVAIAPGESGSQMRGPIKVEFERDAAGALTKIVGNFYVGVGEIEDARGVSIITDR